MSAFRHGRTAAAIGLTLALGVFAAACGSDEDSNSDSGGSSGGSGGGTIALLLPETKNARYETQDKPLFEAKVKELCEDCEVLYYNADQDSAKQQQQGEAALTREADVLVLDPVDSKAGATIAESAKEADVPVISYDRLILDTEIDYYISFDNEAVGKLQGDSLVQALGDDAGSSTIVQINGAPTDNNAKLFKQGASQVFEAEGVTIGKDYDTPDWSPDKAQTQMDQAITALGKDGFQGVYAANDGTAGGAIAALKNAGIDPTTIPVTGQDAELAAIQRILIGEQYMTVYKAIKQEAEAAAEIAVALVNGDEPSSELVSDTTDNGSGDVPSVILTPVEVTKDNIADTIIADGFWTAEQICTDDYADACAEAGIDG